MPQTYLITFLSLLFLTGSLKAQEETTPKERGVILKNLLDQHELRTTYRVYSGPCIVCATAGYNYKKKLTFNATYHPNNDFREGDQIGLGFGSNTAGSGWREGTVYGQTNLDGYRNFDKHTALAGVRYFIFSSIYVAGGMMAQTGSWRRVNFEAANRTIGSNHYDGLAIEVRTDLKNLYRPYWGVGFHHQIWRLGLVLDISASPFRKKVNSMAITTNQPLEAGDLSALEQKVKDDAESEAFGIIHYGITFSF